jgi:hypothetical protein
MTRLALISTMVGAAIIVLRLPGIFWPAKLREHEMKFPRSVLVGRILIGIVALIVWWVMYHAAAESDEWRWTKPLIVSGVPIAYYLVARYGTSYLAMRATAALLLLVAKQMVDATDLSEIPLRLLVTMLAYVWVVAAIWMTIAPHHFRELIGWATVNDVRCQSLCSAGVALGAVLVWLGIFVY